MEFASQICTTKEQSEQLLALGLKKETADCVMMYYDGWHVGVAEDFDFDKDPVEPAWSLHRLIEMMPSVLHDLYELDFSKRGIFYADFSNGSYNFTQAFAKSDKTLYDNIIDCIEWLIKEGYFNKEYLSYT